VVGGGWAWNFDVDLPATLQASVRTADVYRALTLPVGEIFGENSELFSGMTLEYLQELVPGGARAIAIPDAQHHVFLDQPLAFVAALQRMVTELSGGRAP
jgi:pimeloyl-ACP methyl ester carboxylesterase